jgi:hypothetical protein
LTGNTKQRKLPATQAVDFQRVNLQREITMGRREGFRIIALLLAFAMAQAYVQLSFAEPASPTLAAFPPPQLLARLTTKGNLPISVNGISASSGASVANESIIETPANVDAIIDLGPLGSLEIEQQTNIKLEYDGNCLTGSGNISGPQEPALQKCSARVTVYTGCVTAHYKQGAYMQAVTQQQTLIAESDKSRKTAGTFKICSGTPAGAAAVGGGLGSIAKAAIAASIIGGTGLWPIIDNPSSSTP